MTTKNHYRIFWEKTAQGGARVLRIFGESQAVTLPAQIAGCPLTELGNYCFAQNARIPSGGYFIEEIGQSSGVPSKRHSIEETGTNALAHPENKQLDITNTIAELSGSFISSVHLPDTLVKIGDYAFYNCRNLSLLEFGSCLDIIGSDAFMNCHKLHNLHIQCAPAAKSGLRRILAQIPWDAEVSFFEKTGSGKAAAKAAVFYPEYYETYDEIAPAHIFGRRITGEGFRARQCFKDGAVDFTQYDSIFQRACAEESEQTMCRLALDRLRYPVDLAEEKKAQYQDYIRSHAKTLCERLVAEKQLDALSDLFVQKLLLPEDAQYAVLLAADAGWTEGSAGMMRWKQAYYQKPPRSRYKFEDF